MENRITRAIDTLLEALNNGTLAKGNCAACAIGSLVAKAKGVNVSEGATSNWGLHFSTMHGIQKRSVEEIIISEAIRVFLRDKIIDGMNQINSTEFTKDELMKIEFAFETNSEISYFQYSNYTKKEIIEDQVKGLHAVIEVMKTFDIENKDLDVKEAFTNKVLMPV